MTTLENRIEEFKTVCKAFNLRREYGENYSGDEKWAIITALTDEELQTQFGGQYRISKKSFDNWLDNLDNSEDCQVCD